MVGYKSKKFLAESREPDVPELSYHNRETSDMIMEKANADLFYNLRHLKTFKDLSKNNNTVWRIRWEDGKEIEVYNTTTNMSFNVPDIHLAEYICSLHNTSKQIIKEVESKYE